MKQAVTYAALIVLALSWIKGLANEVQPSSRQSIGPSTRPWVAASSFECNYARYSETEQLQWAAREGLLFAPLSFASFDASLSHQGFHEFSSNLSFQRPLNLSMAAVGDVIPGFLSASAGMALNLSHSEAATLDSSFYYTFHNEYNPLDHPYLIPGNRLFGALYLKQQWLGIPLLFAASAERAGLIAFYSGYEMQAAPAYSLQVHSEIPGKASKHMLDFQGSYYGEEKDGRGRAAHQEGALLQFRYGLRRHWGRSGFESAVAAALKGRDKYREVIVIKPLVEEGQNENVQSIRAEFLVASPQSSHVLLQFGWVPSWLFASQDNVFVNGWRSDIDLNLGLSLKQRHILKISGGLFYGNWKAETLMGFRSKLEWSLFGTKESTPSLYPHRLSKQK